MDLQLLGGCTSWAMTPAPSTIFLKNVPRGQAWWYVPIVPATQEADAEESAWAQEFEASLGNIKILALT
jgi:hypothetical protein